MKNVRMHHLALASMITFASTVAAQTPAMWSGVETALGRHGTMQPDGAIKFALPRSDLNVSIDGVALRPAFALSGWLAFTDMGSGMAMAMGDLVLTQDEVAPVMSALQRGGIDETAVHNHLLGETPRVMYMHISGQGDPTHIAQAIRSALDLTKLPPAAAGPPPAPSAELDTAAIAHALGRAGKLNGVVYQYGIARSEKITDHGHVIPPSMGVATAINLEPTGAGRAAITGDFVLRPTEVPLVERALRDNGITVTAVHSHMVNEEPRLLFMHFWANDDAAKLARGLRAALDQTASAKP